MAISLCVFLVGPLNTKVSLLEYFSNLETYKFLVKNSLLVFGVEHNLPAVFGSRGPERMVNAPIWTLVFEIYLYLFIGLLAAFTLRKDKTEDTLFNTLIIVFSLLALILYVYSITLSGFDSKFIEHSVRFSALFGIGSVFYVGRNRIKLSPIILLASIFILAISIKLPFLHKAILYPIIAYALFYLAYIPRGFLLKFNQLGDYSYGVYIFAYPIQQSISHWVTNISTIELFLSSFALSLLLAIFSWHVIENRALKLKKEN